MQHRSRRNLRMRRYDYRKSGVYFVTICTKNRVRYFGTVRDAVMHRSAVGDIAEGCWLAIPYHFPHVSLDAHIIMPDHMHGILHLHSPDFLREWQPGQFGKPMKGALGTVVGSYKSAVTRQCNQRDMPFQWQARYHERVLDSQLSLDNVRRYILNNPKKWRV